MNDRSAPDAAGQLPLFDESPGTTTEPVHGPAKEAIDAPIEARGSDRDADARRFAVDPRHNVVLEASAGTGKTSVLVARYLNLLKAGVDPANILAITFTRKAAAEMRERIVTELRAAAARSELDRTRWAELRDRLGEIQISTIDAFCLSLLREFPLEADLDPGFSMADETEVPRLIEAALDRSLRIFTALAKGEPDVALVIAQLGIPRTREGLAALLDRRLVAWSALNRFLADGPSDLTSEVICRRALISLHDVLRSIPTGLRQWLADGPGGHPRYHLLLRDLAESASGRALSDGAIRGLIDRVAAHFLTQEGKPRSGGAINPYRADQYPSADAGRRHRQAVFQVAPQIEQVVRAFKRDLNVILARGVRRMFAIALEQYRRALEERSVLDFSDVLQRALDLLRQMDEFAQSRYRLEGRYLHVLVDEFQDTSRAQWELVALLIQSWGEGLGVAANPSIFIVGDRKQSIYRFRDAEVGVLHQAARHIEALRPGEPPRRSITRSFRSVPDLLAFVNDVFDEMSQRGERPDDFTYGDADRFPIDTERSSAFPAGGVAVLGIGAAANAGDCAAAVAHEIVRILEEETVRDRSTGIARRARPGDIAILFRSRASHREFEHELERRGVPAYVYKGLGFFDADETKDVVALLRYLARPVSDIRAAAFLRSRFIRLSDRALATLAPNLAAALLSAEPPPEIAALDREDGEVLAHVRRHVRDWVERVDRVPPADLVEQIIVESAYAFELRGPRRQQARENLKKIRALMRRIQNRGYATLPRIADHLDALTAGDESNAVIEALDAVNLMTVHAAKGLEFPVVFVVNLAKGAGGPPKPVRVTLAGDATPSVSVGPFAGDADEAEREREQQELRRLFYVACTRARDRLYFSSVLKEGQMTPGRGSLGEVLPDSFRTLFSRAASAFPECPTVAWTGRSGRVFEFRLCRPPAVADRRLALDRGSEPAQVDLLGPVDDRVVPPPRSVSEWLSHDGCAADARELVIGRLVHKFFQSGRFDCSGERGALDFGHTLLDQEERLTLEDPDGAVDEAYRAWRAMRDQPQVTELLSHGRRLHELPFSFSQGAGGDAVVLRGRIDCLVERPDGSIVVIEFKTGKPRDDHRRQLELYVEAARRMFPEAAVSGQLVYQ